MTLKGTAKRLGSALEVAFRPAWKVLRPRVLPVWHVLRLTVEALGDKNADLMAAGLGFYALISIAPLFVIAVAVGGAIVGAELAQGELHARMVEQLGAEMADFVVSLAEASQDASSGVLATVLSVIALLLASSRLFGTVSSAINTLWGVPDRGKSNFGKVLWRFLRGKLRAIGGVLAAGLVLLGLVAERLVLSFVQALSKDSVVLEAVSFWAWVELLAAMAILTALFTAVFRWLPDRKLPWRPLWIGGAVTAALMLLGRALISAYLGTATIASAYGAAGSVVVFLFWAYYSSLAFLFGATLTYVVSCGPQNATLSKT